MGNIGRPSTGCYLCRKRRVKCDEGRPGCRNCARLKKPCPGYREPGYGLIRTTVFGSKGATPSAERQRGTSSSSEDESDSALSDSILDLSRPRPMTKLPSEVVEESVCYSLAQFDVNSRVLYGNHTYTFLPKILSAAGPNSYLYTAMRSVGAINLANRSPTVDMRATVDLEYARAVSAVTAALGDPERCLKDETLVAVWLLGIREILAGVNGSGPLPSQQTHIDGTLMLLRLRGEAQFSRPEGRLLFETILSAMHWKPLLASEEPSQEYLQLESQIPKATPFVPGASLKLRTFFHGVSKLRARIKNFLGLGEDVSIDRPKMVNTYLKAAAKLEEKVNGWCDLPSWLPHNVIEDSTSRFPRTPWTSGTQFRRTYFETWAGFFHWNKYVVAKICLHAALLDAIKSQLGDDQDLISFHTTVVHETVRFFLGTLAYAFGDVDELGCLRPLPTAVVSDGAVSEHRGVNIPATLQIHMPLSYLITLKYLAPGQREGMFVALQRMRAEFSVR